MAIIIRSFIEADADEVHRLFVAVNKLLSPPDMIAEFEAYIQRSLAEEIDRIPAYYGERDGGFWVATNCGKLAGMFGLEGLSRDAVELRRMYVAPEMRRKGVASSMLEFAEVECRRRRKSKMKLSTSELQLPALHLYQKAGYRLLREVIAEEGSNKTIGGGIRRFELEKDL